LLVRCVIGITPEERREKQDVLISITLGVDLRAAGRSDRLEDCVDYRSIKKRVLAEAEASQFFLVEALAEHIADLCLTAQQVEQVTVQVMKPSALRFARSVGVVITRDRMP